jgi:DNA-binding winged helix-turn-helix (wHTH) protein
MASPDLSQSTIRFGEFSTDLEARELHRNGVKVKLQGQPFEVLALLLSRPGRIVSREEFHKRLWPDDTFVDFEHGLNAAVNRLREALEDSSEDPRFIETIPRRGYKFIAPLYGQPDKQLSLTASPFFWRPLRLAGLGTLAIFVLTAATLWFWATRSPKVISWTELSFGKQAACGLFATDGSRIYFTVYTRTRSAAWPTFPSEVATTLS